MGGRKSAALDEGAPGFEVEGEFDGGAELGAACAAEAEGLDDGVASFGGLLEERRSMSRLRLASIWWVCA